MDGQQVSMVTEIFVDILFGCFSVATLAWAFVAVQTFINDRKTARRDEEYHQERMKQYQK